MDEYTELDYYLDNPEASKSCESCHEQPAEDSDILCEGCFDMWNYIDGGCIEE